MSVLKSFDTLNNETTIPKIGFGTWQIPNAEVFEPVAMALRNGYRHIDTAAAYGNEAGVGEAVRASGIARDQLYITTKVPAELKSYEEAKHSIERSLELLDLEYIDLILIHAPKPWSEMFTDTTNTYYEENVAVWKALEDAYRAGTVKSIGVSNFSVEDLQNIQSHSDIVPAVNQIRYHIGHTQDEIVAYCKANNILVEGYSPIATGKLLHNDVVARIAKTYNKSVAQICIQYLLQNGILPLPKSTHEEYIIQNADLDFVISDDDIAALNDLESDA